MTISKYASEGELFKKIMGHKWNNLHPNIQERFNHKASPTQPLQFVGELTELRCSFWGKILAYLTQPFIAGALIPYNSNQCAVDIDVYTEEHSSFLYKKRLYKIPNRKPIEFISYMTESKTGDILEYVGCGIGMKLLVFEKETNLHFKSDGYFIDIGLCCLPIPKLFSPGDIYLIHINEGKDKFRIVIDITHKWLGKMFLQKGIFHSVS